MNRENAKDEVYEKWQTEKESDKGRLKEKVEENGREEKEGLKEEHKKEEIGAQGGG